jgi:hypothetical protein
MGSGVLGTWVETHNPHCLFSLSLFFQALLLAALASKALLLKPALKTCLKPLSLDLLCHMFSLSLSLA